MQFIAVLFFILLGGCKLNSSTGDQVELAEILLEGSLVTTLNASFAGSQQGVIEGAQGTQATLNIPVDLSGVTSQSVAVTVAIQNATAQASEYQLLNSSVIIPQGQTRGFIRVNIIGDDIDEFDEVFDVVIVDASIAAIGLIPRFTVRIIDDDAPPVGNLPALSFQTSNSSVIEGNSGTKQVSMNLQLSAPQAAGAPVSVSLQVEPTSTASVPSDITCPTSVVFSAGAQSAMFSCTIMGDTQVESNENLVLKLVSPVQAVLGPIQTHTIQITNDDVGQGPNPIIQFSAASQSVVEGNSGMKLVSLIIQSSLSSTSAIGFNLQTVNGSTASVPADISCPSSGSIPAGQLSVTLQCAVVGDTIPETHENLMIQLVPSAPAVVGSISQHTIVITNDDSGGGGNLPTVNFISTSQSVNEGNSGSKIVNFVVSLDFVSGAAIVVPIQVLATSTAQAGVDFSNCTSVLNFAAGVSSLPGSCTIDGDAIIEADETIELMIGLVTGAQVGIQNQHTITVSNDDSAQVDVLASTHTVNELDQGVTTVVGIVLLSDPVDFLVRVPLTLNTANTTATAGVDFVPTTSTEIVFPPMAKVAAFQFDVKGDTSAEAVEKVVYSLGSPVPNIVSLGAANFNVSIIDDDQLLSFSTPFDYVQEGSGVVSVQVYSKTPVASNLVIPISVWPLSTAIAGVNYTCPANMTVTIPAGQVSATFNACSLIQDQVKTENLTLAFNLGKVAGYSWGTYASHQVTMIDTDTQPPACVNNQVVAQLQFPNLSGVANVGETFFARGVIPLPPLEYKLQNSQVSYALLETSGTVVPTSIDIGERDATGNYARAVELSGVLTRTSTSAMQIHNVVRRCQAPLTGTTPLTPEIQALLNANPNHFSLMTKDIHGNTYRTTGIGSGLQKTFYRSTPMQTTYRVFTPFVPFPANQPGANAHLMGVEWYITTRANQDYAMVDLRISNSGNKFGGPLNSSIGRHVYDSFLLFTPPGYSAHVAFPRSRTGLGDPSTNELLNDAIQSPFDGATVWAHQLLAPKSNGQYFVFPNGVSTTYRMLIRASGLSGSSAYQLLRQTGLGFVKEGTVSGFELYSWWNPKTARFTFNEPIRTYTANEISQMTAGFAARENAYRQIIRSGIAPKTYNVFEDEYENIMGMDYAYGGATGGGGVSHHKLHSVNTAAAASLEGLNSIIAMHEMYMNRHSNYYTDPNGDPLDPQFFLTQGQSVPDFFNTPASANNGGSNAYGNCLGDTFTFNGGQLYKDTYGICDGLRLSHQATGHEAIAKAQGLIDLAARDSLISLSPIDYQHYKRVVSDAESLVSIADDTLGKSTLLHLGSASLMAHHFYTGGGGAGLEALGNSNPGKGAVFGRGEGWGNQAIADMYGILMSDTKRAFLFTHFQKLIDSLDKVQIKCPATDLSPEFGTWYTSKTNSKSDQAIADEWLATQAWELIMGMVAVHSVFTNVFEGSVDLVRQVKIQDLMARASYFNISGLARNSLSNAQRVIFAVREETGRVVCSENDPVFNTYLPWWNGGTDNNYIQNGFGMGSQYTGDIRSVCEAVESGILNNMSNPNSQNENQLYMVWVLQKYFNTQKPAICP